MRTREVPGSVELQKATSTRARAMHLQGQVRPAPATHHLPLVRFGHVRRPILADCICTRTDVDVHVAPANVVPGVQVRTPLVSSSLTLFQSVSVGLLVPMLLGMVHIWRRGCSRASNELSAAPASHTGIQVYRAPSHGTLCSSLTALPVIQSRCASQLASARPRNVVRLGGRSYCATLPARASRALPSLNTTLTL